jgi:hypothetical protein
VSNINRYLCQLIMIVTRTRTITATRIWTRRWRQRVSSAGAGASGRVGARLELWFNLSYRHAARTALKSGGSLLEAIRWSGLRLGLVRVSVGLGWDVVKCSPYPSPSLVLAPLQPYPIPETYVYLYSKGRTKMFCSHRRLGPYVRDKSRVRVKMWLTRNVGIE